MYSVELSPFYLLFTVIMSSDATNIVVVGAGVLGLTTAMHLADNLSNVNVNVNIKVIAKDLPGLDNPPLFASPKAGAHWSSPRFLNDPIIQKRHVLGYKKFKELSLIDDCWVKQYDIYTGNIGLEEEPFKHAWYKSFVDDYEYIGTDPIKFPGVDQLVKFKTYTISTTYYLIWQMNSLIKSGISIERRSIDKLSNVEFIENSGLFADIVINCTGLQYNELKDEPLDPNLIPIRGHTLILENNLPYQVHFDESSPVEQGEFLMVFPRKEGGCVLGGIYDQHSPLFDESIHDDYVKRLILKAKKHIPELGNDYKLVKHNIGFRPGRIGGARVELDKFNKKLIHNYGCGSLGYIESWGCADDVLNILQKLLHPSKL
ncbi:hypothetical protein CANARDRAFT_24856 [[Candida] arabinofermentans NRRL YB-2248]|uniref:FAD dependent oxidoreductase domain-containing protein n=1 Tax=[Candida] arabinofermentans NRRL YB-2248 TaxID=983967 RepID=A0A1E4SVT4_9ASCO|nr:hypothetical protein CANARDRAFT_24856 [[Candida] arabinofermentans NRRL YB-2248]